MNDAFFHQYGLHALIMCYKPSDNLEPSDSTAQAIVKHDSKSKFSGADGMTRSELELPECAPLIFPQLDEVDEKKKSNVIKRSGVFLGDYYDRRAQAQFVSNETAFQATEH